MWSDWGDVWKEKPIGLEGWNMVGGGVGSNGKIRVKMCDAIY